MLSNSTVYSSHLGGSVTGDSGAVGPVLGPKPHISNRLLGDGAAAVCVPLFLNRGLERVLHGGNMPLSARSSSTCYLLSTAICWSLGVFSMLFLMS